MAFFENSLISLSIIIADGKSPFLVYLVLSFSSALTYELLILLISDSRNDLSLVSSAGVSAKILWIERKMRNIVSCFIFSRVSMAEGFYGLSL